MADRDPARPLDELHICRQPGYDAVLHRCLGCLAGEGDGTRADAPAENELVARALAFVAEFQGDPRCSLNCVHAEALAREVHRLAARDAALAALVQQLHEEAAFEFTNSNESYAQGLDHAADRLAALLETP